MEPPPQPGPVGRTGMMDRGSRSRSKPPRVSVNKLNKSVSKEPKPIKPKKKGNKGIKT